MMEFNPDGSIRLPGSLGKRKEEREYKLKSEKCVLFTKEVVSEKAPKKCVLHLNLSDAFMDNGFVEKIYYYFKNKADVPTKLIKLNDKEFDIEIGTCFRRCSDCNSLIARFREHLFGNVIEEKGSCHFKERIFHYEDYFS